MTKKKNKGMKPMHSKQTGKYILILLLAFVVFGAIFSYLAFNETEKIKQNEQRFRALSCQEMKDELKNDTIKEPWKIQAINDKVECQK